MPQDDDEEGEAQDLLASDYLRAEFLRDRLVPKAVLFFTGEALEDEDDVSWLYASIILLASFHTCHIVSCKRPPPLFDDPMVHIYMRYTYKWHVCVSAHPRFWPVKLK